MTRRNFVIEQLGLSPLWVRRTRVGSQRTARSNEALEVQGDLEHTSSPACAGVAARATQIGTMDWAVLRDSVLGCNACELHRARKQAVFGVGDTRAEWLFVGEGPGADEDDRGEPFVGQAGKLLDNMLSAIALQRGRNVYIANIVKCRPPGNRTPEPAEAQACAPYLVRQISLIAPRLIIALGRVAAQNLLGIEATLASLRGRVHQYGGIPVIVTYHPAYLLRNPADKAKSWEDLCSAVDMMALLKKSASAPN